MANPASKLEPFREFIASERRKRTPYRRIAELLAEQGIQVDYSTIHSFVKVRAKPPRKVITMWEPGEAQATLPPRISTAAAKAPQSDVSEAELEHLGQHEAVRRLKQAKPGRRRSSKGLPSFKEDAPLDQLSEEEARRLRSEL
jgi:hypothetical protein